MSTISFAVIGYHFNCLDGQLNCQVFTHCIIGRAAKLSTVCGMAQKSPSFNLDSFICMINGNCLVNSANSCS